MNRVHLVLLWHMHQPQYRDPASGRYGMPWSRLHALKDYWGMVKILEQTPGFHATVNVVPSLGMQLEEYAGGQFDEPWFRLAFLPAEQLEDADKLELLARGFQVNRDNLLRRWPRYVELFERVQQDGAADCAGQFGPRDWRDLQLLSQLAWMDEEYLAKDEVVAALNHKGANFTELEKESLRSKQMELLGRVLPEYRAAAARGQVEFSTTPFYHPILPLLCDSDVARIANPHTPLPQPPFRHPGDAREQLRRAREYHERVFGQAPAGLWPSEGSVSDHVLEMAAELGFRWFGADEGVLGRTLGTGFGRDAGGVPDNAAKLYSPLRVRRGGREICGVFRDHHISDLVGFVYSRMSAAAAAEDLHRRIRAIGERVDSAATGGKPLTVSIILDGENAWEYFPGAGRDFLRQFYRRIEGDGEIRALTVSEAIAAAGEIPVVEAIAPGSWINANFDVWIGHAEDVQAWNLLRDARDFYTAAEKRAAEGTAGAPSKEQLASAYESLLAAEGSDWCWWYGPEHSSTHDAEFDALYRKHLTQIYVALGQEAPEQLTQPIKRQWEKAMTLPPASFLSPQLDGRETSYFEWMGAGVYSAQRQSGAMHGRSYLLHEIQYGFDENFLYVRVNPFHEAVAELNLYEFRVTLRCAEELRVRAVIAEQTLCLVEAERGGGTLFGVTEKVKAAYGKFLELKIARDLIPVAGRTSVGIHVGLWESGLPVDLLPAEGWVEARLGPDAFGWAV